MDSPASSKDVSIYKKHPLDYLIAFLLLLTLVGTVIGAVASRRQGNAAHKSLLVMRDQERRQLRAYLVPKGVIIQTNGARASDGELMWELGIQEKNSGQTPAISVRSFEGFIKLPRSINVIDLSQFISAEPSKAQTTVGANDDTGGSFAAISSNLFAEALENKSRLIMFGKSTYLDVFRTPHMTMSCYIVGFPSGRDPNVYVKGSNARGTADFCPVGNCIDDECANQAKTAPLGELAPVIGPPVETYDETAAHP